MRLDALGPGPVRFDVFQEAALYAPERGYYEARRRVGREGDFVTGPSWHPAFGRCLARVARELAGLLGPGVDVVDVGAGEGELLEVLAGELGAGGGGRLAGVERSAVRRGEGGRRVPEASWYPAVADLPPVRGLVVAYELFDALPVRALRVAEDGTLVERMVARAEDGSFHWVDGPCGDGDAVAAALERRGAHPEPGQLLEVRPGAASLAATLASRLAEGLLLVFDYGAPARALYGPSRPLGTLEAFRNHRVTRDVLTEPGSRDITAWVDFTELEEVFRREGLTVHGLVSQARLLAAAGIAAELVAFTDGRAPTLDEQRERDAVLELVRPGGMGESLRVLVAERGTSVGGRLTEWPAAPPTR